MKLEIARGLFLLVALAVASVAFAAWEEPLPQVLSSIYLGAQCPLPRTMKCIGPSRVKPAPPGLQ